MGALAPSTHVRAQRPRWWQRRLHKKLRNQSWYWIPAWRATSRYWPISLVVTSVIYISVMTRAPASTSHAPWSGTIRCMCWVESISTTITRSVMYYYNRLCVPSVSIKTFILDSDIANWWLYFETSWRLGLQFRCRSMCCSWASNRQWDIFMFSIKWNIEMSRGFGPTWSIHRYSKLNNLSSLHENCRFRE